MIIDIFILFFSFFIITLGLGVLRKWSVSNQQLNMYSIIVACRNEEKHLPFLLKSLSRLDYDPRLYEIIIVDDASSDDSVKIIKDFIRKRNGFSLYQIREKSGEFLGKKMALKSGLEKAKFPIILFTDADCVVPENWLQSYNKYFDSSTGMVLGYSPEVGASGFRRFVNLASAGIYAATTGFGFPFSCTGRNFAVRKKILQQVGGYDKIKHFVSGDDKLVLSLITKIKTRIKYNAEAKVYTFEETENFGNQQKRRFGKFFMNSLPWKIICLIVLAFYLYLPFRVIVHRDIISLLFYWLSCLFSWISNCVKHQENIRIADFVFILVYPYFVVYYSVKGIMKKWSWKR